MSYQGHRQRDEKHRLRSYAGVRPDISDTIEFRSAWEANFARILNHLNIKWCYEPQRFWLDNQLSYLPDFRLDSPNPWNVRWIEIKGLWNYGDKAKLRYFMGKYPDEKIRVITSKKYSKLSKEFRKLIPNWEGYSKVSKAKAGKMKLPNTPPPIGTIGGAYGTLVTKGTPLTKKSKKTK